MQSSPQTVIKIKNENVIKNIQKKDRKYYLEKERSKKKRKKKRE